MKAIVYTKYGSPDVLQIREVDKPTPGDNELLIKVHVTTVNRTDCATIRAKPFFMRIITGLFKPKKKSRVQNLPVKLRPLEKTSRLLKQGIKCLALMTRVRCLKLNT